MSSEHKKGKAAKWRASDLLMRMMDEELKGSTPTAPSPFSIRVLEAIAEAKRDRPEQVGMRPIKVSPWRTGKGR
jgi:hypothetical protein